MKTRQQYALLLAQKKRAILTVARVRNPSKNTAKKIMRRAWLCENWGEPRWNTDDQHNYFLFNVVGSRLYVVSKGKICNREPKGYRRYLAKK